MPSTLSKITINNKLNLLPVTLYIDMHDVLYLTRLTLQEEDLQVKSSLSQTKPVHTQDRQDNNKIHKSRLQKTNNSFFHRSALLMNIVR